jgi:mannose-1-phosphate guanylyltransferase
MKAFLLAAGAGTRLRPLTDHLPKCLIPIGGKPLLEIWFEQLEKLGVTEVRVNTHHLAAQVEAYVAARPPSGLRISLFHEPTLLGSAGTIRANRDWLAQENDFLIIYADNLTNANLAGLVQFHRDRNADFTLALFQTKNPRECGIVVRDESGLVTEFQEKPAAPKSSWANAGLYMARPSLFDAIPDQPGLCDFGFDVLPRLMGRMYAFPLTGFYCDIGTIERLEYARHAWRG